MKRFTMCLSFLVSLLILTPSAFAMEVMADSELDAVSGQTGVDISVYDVSMDLDIQNIAWGDPDCGTLIVSGVPVTYGPGYLNVNHIKIKNLYITMATSKCILRPVLWRSRHLPRSPALSARILSSSCCPNPLTIDVVSQGNNPREDALADGGKKEKDKQGKRAQR